VPLSFIADGFASSRNVTDSSNVKGQTTRNSYYEELMEGYLTHHACIFVKRSKFITNDKAEPKAV
jgi:hypothetical protein